MAWYRTGTIAVTNGSPTIVGTGTAWIAASRAGDALHGPDGRVYEVLSVNSDTGITLVSNYLGSSASGQAYAIQPTQDYQRTLAAQAAALVNDYSTVKNNAGAGLFGGGTLSQPGVRSTGDTDTGLAWLIANALSLVGGGAEQMRVIGTAGANRAVTVAGSNGGRPGINTTGGDLDLASATSLVRVSGNMYATGGDGSYMGFGVYYAGGWKTSIGSGIGFIQRMSSSAVQFMTAAAAGVDAGTTECEQVRLLHTAAANRALTLTGSNGAAPTIGTTGGDLWLTAGADVRVRRSDTASTFFNIDQAGADTTSRPALNLVKNGSVQLQLSASGAGGGTIYYEAFGVASNHQFYAGGAGRWGIYPGNLSPIVDNSQSLGTSSNRPSVIYAATGTINTSDAREKTDVKDLTLGLDFLRELRPVSHRWATGTNAVEVVDSPTEFEDVTEPVTEPVAVAFNEIQIIEGKPVMVRGTRTEKRAIVDMLPVLDEAGQPVMVEQPQPPLVSEIEIEGKLVRVETPQPPRKVPMTHAVERTHVVRRPKRVQVVTPRPGSRRHAAFLAQDVKAALDAVGVDLGMWTLDDASDPTSRQGLRYEQFIPVLTRALVELDDERRAITERVAALEAAVGGGA